jgi:hypothetical protein
VTKTKNKTLTVDIEPVPYTGPSGVRFQLVLDPTARRVAVFRNIGPGTPQIAFDKRAWTFRLPTSFHGQDLKDALPLEDLTALADCYRGSKWTGSNHTGSWSDDADHYADAVRDGLQVRSYMDGGELAEWYSHEVTREDIRTQYPQAVRCDLNALKNKIRNELKNGNDDYPRASEAAIESAAEWMIERAGELADPTVTCSCGETSGVPCEWSGPESETVLIAWMPNEHRASHTAAGNRGFYPHNGSVRLRVHSDCADRVIEADGGWASIVEVD